MKNLLGVVLCGGDSKRMGSDKGLLKIHEKTWAEFAVDKLLAFDIPVVVSINEQQQELYGKIFSGEQLIVDCIDIKGPLRGLLSVHQCFSNKDILLMGCDLIDMNHPTLKNLIDQYQANPSFSYYAYQESFAEPLCAVYTSQGLLPVLEKAKLHALIRFSFQNILDEGNTYRIPINDRAPFKNYNTIPGHHQGS